MSRTIESLEEIKTEVHGCLTIISAGIKLLDLENNKIVRRTADLIIKNDLHRVKSRLNRLV